MVFPVGTPQCGVPLYALASPMVCPWYPPGIPFVSPSVFPWYRRGNDYQGDIQRIPSGIPREYQGKTMGIPWEYNWDSKKTMRKHIAGYHREYHGGSKWFLFLAPTQVAQPLGRWYGSLFTRSGCSVLLVWPGSPALLWRSGGWTRRVFAAGSGFPVRVVGIPPGSSRG